MRKMCVLVEGAEQDPVQRARRGEVAPERLFDDDARARACSRPARAAPRPSRTAPAESRGSAPDAARRRAPCAAPGTSPHRRSRRRRSAAGSRASRTPRHRAPPCFSRLSLRPRLQLVEVPAGLGDADHRHVEMAALDHRLQRRKDLLVREVAGGAEEHQRVGMELAHRDFPRSARYLPDGFSRWPPNS